jgi:hypothetical protein
MNVKPEKYGGSIQGQRVLELYWMIDTFKANGVKSYLEIGLAKYSIVLLMSAGSNGQFRLICRAGSGGCRPPKEN